MSGPLGANCQSHAIQVHWAVQHGVSLGSRYGDSGEEKGAIPAGRGERRPPAVVTDVITVGGARARRRMEGQCDRGVRVLLERRSGWGDLYYLGLRWHRLKSAHSLSLLSPVIVTIENVPSPFPKGHPGWGQGS